MGKLYYFQAPSFNINPDSQTAPKLGSIYSHLDRLTGPLNQEDFVSIPENLKNQSTVLRFDETTGHRLEVRGGLSASFGQGLVGAADLIYALSRNKNNVYSCRELETVEFEPTPQFVADCVTASHRVQSFLQDGLVGYRRVYMITGLKIATGFTMSSTTEVQHNPKLKISGSAALTGVPVDGGPELEIKVDNSRTVAHEQTTNKIVFAYRVIRIKLRGDGSTDFSFRSGGRYGVDDDDEDEDEEGKWEIEPLVVEERLNDFPDSVLVEVIV